MQRKTFSRVSDLKHIYINTMHVTLKASLKSKLLFGFMLSYKNKKKKQEERVNVEAAQ